MSEAPNEKHLEDWIVANPEKTFVDFLSKRLMFANQIIARQPSFPSGIPDLITRNWEGNLAIIELKKGCINDRCVSQILRYKYDLLCLWESIATDIFASGMYSHLNIPITPHFEAIRMILIGNSIKSVNTTMACYGAGITALKYEFIDGEYHFDLPSPHDWNKRRISRGIQQGTFPKIDSLLCTTYHRQASRVANVQMMKNEPKN